MCKNNYNFIFLIFGVILGTKSSNSARSSVLMVVQYSDFCTSSISAAITDKQNSYKK
jgi:hypothetical protein